MNRTSIVFLTILVALAGCAATGRTAGPPAAGADGPPQKLSASIGGPMSWWFSFEYRDGRLLYKATAPDGKTAREVEVVPTPAQWSAFRAELEAVGVWDWRPEYVNPNTVDGTWWGLELGMDGRKVASKGKNSYPGARGGSTGPDPSPEFTRYLEAVQRLLGGLNFR